MDDEQVVELDAAADTGAPAEGGQGSSLSPSLQAEGGQPAAQAVVEPEISLKDILKQVQELKTGLGRIPQLQSRLDSLPKTQEEAFKKLLAEQQQTQLLNQLAPEQRAEYQAQLAEQQRQQAELRKMMQEVVKETLPGEYNGVLETTQRMQDQFAAQDFFESIEQKVGGKEQMQKLAPIIGELLAEHQRKIASGDPALMEEAAKWMDEAMKAPANVALEALSKFQSKVFNGQQQVVQQRLQAGQKLSQGIRGASNSNGPVKSLNGMSEKDMRALAGTMSTEAFEKLVVASKGA